MCTKQARCTFTCFAPMVIMQSQRMKDLLQRASVAVRTSNMKIARRRLAVKNLASQKNWIKKRAARAARSFFLNKPIKPLICDVVVVVPFLYSLFLRWQFDPCQLFFFDTKFSCFTFPPTRHHRIFTK